MYALLSARRGGRKSRPRRTRAYSSSLSAVYWGRIIPLLNLWGNYIIIKHKFTSCGKYNIHTETTLLRTIYNNVVPRRVRDRAELFIKKTTGISYGPRKQRKTVEILFRNINYIDEYARARARSTMYRLIECDPGDKHSRFYRTFRRLLFVFASCRNHDVMTVTCRDWHRRIYFIFRDARERSRSHDENEVTFNYYGKSTNITFSRVYTLISVQTLVFFTPP